MDSVAKSHRFFQQDKIDNAFEQRVVKKFSGVDASCWRPYTLQKALAESIDEDTGLYLACKDDAQNNAAACGFAVKLFALQNDAQKQQSFAKEKEVAERLSKIGVAPPLHLARTCASDSIGVLVMDRLDGTLLDLVPKIRKQTSKEQAAAFEAQIASQVDALVQAMHRAGYVHGDLHEENIVYRAQSAAPFYSRLYLIDFGRSSPIADRDSSEEMREEMSAFGMQTFEDYVYNDFLNWRGEFNWRRFPPPPQVLTTGNDNALKAEQRAALLSRAASLKENIA